MRFPTNKVKHLFEEFKKTLHEQNEENHSDKRTKKKQLWRKF